jgi:hypothetical protein
MADSTEVIVLDLRTEVLRARRAETEALRTSRRGALLKSVLGALLLLAASAIFFVLLRR